MIAALFVASGGVYTGRQDVDPWDEARDARKYAGPHPVVAHPPCNLWVSMAHANYARWGGEHNKPGNDQWCFVSALDSVLTWGGVLEHPAFSQAWRTYKLTPPSGVGVGWKKVQDHWGDYWVCEVWQSAYGHLARKRTWLLYAGKRPAEMRWERTPGTHQIGYHDQRGKARNKPTVSKRNAKATPKAFAQALIALAENSKVIKPIRVTVTPSDIDVFNEISPLPWNKQK